jgi:hypothetical protein
VVKYGCVCSKLRLVLLKGRKIMRLRISSHDLLLFAVLMCVLAIAFTLRGLKGAVPVIGFVIATVMYQRAFNATSRLDKTAFFVGALFFAIASLILTLMVISPHEIR